MAGRKEGVCLVDKYRGAAPARLLFDGISSQDATQTVNALGSAMTCQLRVLDSDDSVSPHAASGWCIHCGVEVTELSTNKQHTLRARSSDHRRQARDRRCQAPTAAASRPARPPSLVRGTCPSPGPAQTFLTNLLESLSDFPAWAKFSSSTTAL